MFKGSGGCYTSHEIKTTPEFERDLISLSVNLGIIQIDLFSMYKGFILRIEQYSVILPTAPIIILNNQNEPITELSSLWYKEQLMAKGLMKSGKFVRDHPEFVANTPVVAKRTRPERIQRQAQSQSFTCMMCDIVCKSMRGLTYHNNKKH